MMNIHNDEHQIGPTGEVQQVGSVEFNSITHDDPPLLSSMSRSGIGRPIGYQNFVEGLYCCQVGLYLLQFSSFHNLGVWQPLRDAIPLIPNEGLNVRTNN